MDVRIVLTVVLTVLPFLLLLRYYYTRDVFREPRDALVRTFLLGLLVTMAAIPIEFGLGAVPLRLGPLGAALYTAFVVAAIPEESLKLLVIARYCARRKSFDERMDGIVYGATAALGFAALENVIYVAGGGLATAAIRSVTSVPMHAVWGAVLGYYVARARLGGRRHDLWKGWALAVIAHGLFDFALLGSVAVAGEDGGAEGSGLLILALLLLFVVVVIVCWVAMRRLVRRLHTEQLATQAHERETERTALALGQHSSPVSGAPLGAHIHAGATAVEESQADAPRELGDRVGADPSREPTPPSVPR